MANELELENEEISLENISDPNYVAPVDDTEELKLQAEAVERERLEKEKAKEAEEGKTTEENAISFFNKNGDQVDAKGAVIRTKAELDAEQSSAAEEEIEIPELYNNKGDLVDLQGNVLKTKEQLESNITEDDSVVDIILKTYNIKPTDAEGNPLTLTDTLEDFQKTVNLVVQKEKEKETLNLFESLPLDVQKYYIHRANNGKPEEFFSNLSFDIENVKLEENNTDQLKDIIKRGALSRGYNLSEAERLIKKSEATKELYDDAKIELEYMQSREADLRKEQSAYIAQERKKQQDEATTTTVLIKNTIASKNIGGLKVVDNDVTPFTQFMLAKGNDQLTQYEKALSSLTAEQELKLAYYIYKGYDVSKLVQEKANEAIVLKLRKQAEERQKGIHTPLPKGEITNDQITLDSIT